MRGGMNRAVVGALALMAAFAPQQMGPRLGSFGPVVTLPGSGSTAPVALAGTAAATQSSQRRRYASGGGNPWGRFSAPHERTRRRRRGSAGPMRAAGRRRRAMLRKARR